MTQPKGDSEEGQKAGSSSALKTPAPESPPSTNVASPPVWQKDGAPSPAPASGSETWPPQKVVAGRYRIVRFLGRGGMGDVYEAEDLDLLGRVALKTVRLGIAVDPLLSERFRREIQIARKVTHPNICRIYDVGYDRPAAPEGSGATATEVRFLTMELLAGETLSKRISRGRLSTAGALPIVEQMAAGLDAIHALGIVHRDFKSGNVMLVPSTDPRRPVRAVITDFGLARPENKTESLISLSETGGVVGTPAYMAPEQVQGKELTLAADLYALGIVMYEMVTGVRPFDGSALTVALKHVNEAPPPPQSRVRDLDPAWEATILRCLHKDPAGRFARASDVVRALGGAAVTPPPSSADVSGATQSVVIPSTARTKPHRRPPLLAAAAALIAAAIGSYLWQRQRSAPIPSAASSPAAAPVTLRRAVAVLGFKNVSGRKDSDWLSTVLSEMLAVNLGAGGKVRILPPPEVARLKTDLSLEDAESYGKDHLAKVRQNLAADVVVAGSYTSMDEVSDKMLRLEARLQDTASGETLVSGSATGTEQQLFDLVSRAAAPLREKLGLGALAASQAVEVQAVLPVDPAAARSYAEGLAKLRLFDAKGAQQALEKAVSLESKHPLPHAALSEAYSSLGYEAKARAEAKTAAELAATLPREQKLAIEGRLHETNKDWAQAIETYRGLFNDSPDNPDYGLRLAEAQVAAGKGREALATVEQLRKLPSPVSADPRIDLAEAFAYNRLGELKHYQSAAIAAATKASAQGARLLLARARLYEGTALIALGKPKDALKPLEDARALYEAAGDRGRLARSLEQMGLALRAAGDLDGAKRILDRALAIHREIGDQTSAARVLHNTGIVLLAQGKLAEAQRLEDEALATFQQAGAKFEAAAALNDMGSRLQRAGDLAAAAKRYEQALRLSGETGERRGIAIPLSNLAEVLFLRGELKRSQEMLEEALAIEREVGRKAGVAYKLFRLGELFRAKGDLGVATDRYNEARAAYGELGDKTGVADTQSGLAEIAMEKKQFDQAMALAREAEETLRGAKANDRAALAQMILAESLLAQGKLAEASRIEQQGLWKNSQDRFVRLSGAITAARLKAAAAKAPDVAAAIQSLNATLTECVKAGLVQCQFETRLAMGQIELASGKTTAAKARLKALATEAEGRGYGSMARQASEATASVR